MCVNYVTDLKLNLFLDGVVIWSKKHQRGQVMEHGELEEDRAAFIAGEIGGVVIQLIIEGIEINRDNIVEYLEAKRKAVGNVIHKGILRDSAAMVRKGA